MKLFFRACELQESMSYVKRLNNMPKVLIMKKCWLSLQFSIHETEDSIYVLNDNLQPETLEFLVSTNTCRNFDIIDVPAHNVDHCLHNVVLFDALEKNLGEDKDFHFIIEDDYLWVPNALTVFRELLQYWDGFVVPQDYPDRYRDRIPCTVVAGPDRPWRTITSSTWNMGGTTEAWKRWLCSFKEAAPSGNDKILDDIYLQTPCISPLPGLATHLTDGPHNTPYVDWNGVWELLQLPE